MTDALLATWCQIRLNHRKKTNEVFESATKCVREIAQEIIENGGQVREAGTCMGYRSSVQAVYMFPAAVRESQLITVTYNHLHQKQPEFDFQMYFSSVLIFNRYLGMTYIGLRNIMSDPQEQRHLRWAMQFNGECQICFDDFKSGAYHFCNN
eukprot:3933927-Rhodomonas_salina.1